MVITHLNCQSYSSRVSEILIAEFSPNWRSMIDVSLVYDIDRVIELIAMDISPIDYAFDLMYRLREVIA